MLRWIIVALGVALAGCATTPSVSGAYFFKLSPDKQRNTYVSLSANGEAIAGVTGEKHIWVWAPTTGTTNIATEPPSYFAPAVAINADGTVVAGIFKSLNQHHPSGLFLWTKANGLRLLPKLPPNETVSAPIQLSDDGKTLLFYCYSSAHNSPPLPCNGAPFQSSHSNEPLKIWSQSGGYQNLPRLPSGNFNYIRVSGDLKTYLLGKDHAWNNNPKLATKPSFGFQNADGRYVALNPAPFSFSPKSGFIISNDEMTLVSAPSPFVQASLLWNATGQLSFNPKLPPGCQDFIITAIDRNGTIFGLSGCSKGIVGFRVTASGVQTISSWLQSEGTGRDFPENTVVWKVSDNGKLIEGTVGLSLAVVSGGIPIGRSGNTTIYDFPSPDEGGIAGSLFVAHVP